MTIKAQINRLKRRLRRARNENEEGRLLIRLCEKYVAFSALGFQMHVNRLNEIGEKLHKEEFKAWALYFESIRQRFNRNPSVALEKAQKSLEVFKSIKHQLGVSDALNNLGLIYKVMLEYEKARENFQASLEVSENAGSKKRIATAHSNMGVIYDTLGDSLQALQHHQIALNIRRKIRDIQGIAISLNNIGFIKEKRANYLEAFQNYSDSLKLSEKLEDSFGIACAYENMGNLDRIKGNINLAIKNYNVALKILLNTSVDHKEHLAVLYNNIGNIQAQQREFAKAIKSHNASLRLKSANDIYGIAFTYINVGNIYSDQNKYDAALKKFAAALKLVKNQGDKRIAIAAYFNIGLTRLKKSRGRYGLPIAVKAANIAIAIEAWGILRDGYLALSELFKKYNKSKKALFYFTEYHKISSKILSDDIQRQLSQRELEFNVERIKHELERKKLQVAEAENARMDADYLYQSALTAPHSMMGLLHEVKEFYTTARISEGNQLLADYKDYYSDLLLIAGKEITLTEELNLLKTYLGFKKLRADIDDFNFPESLPSYLNFIYVPSYFSKGIIDNSIKHGFSEKLAGRKYITIKIKRHKNKQVELIFEDTGAGLGAGTKQGMKTDLVSLEKKIKYFNHANKNQKIFFKRNISLKNKFSKAGQIQGCICRFIFKLKQPQ